MDVTTSSLTSEDLDALREVSNIGAGNAASALSRVIGDVVSLEVPVVRALELSEVPTALGGVEQKVVAIHLAIHGDVTGNLLITWEPAAALSLLRRMGLAVTDIEDPRPILGSALREVGNILGSTYLSAISRLVHQSLIPSVPGLAMDMAGAIADLLVIDLSAPTERTLVLETSFQEKSGPIQGRFLLLPDPRTLPALVRRVRSLP